MIRRPPRSTLFPSTTLFQYINATEAPRQRRPAFGGDVDDAGGMQAVLRGHRPGDQPHAADERTLKNLRETGNAVGQQNSIDAILNIAVLVADVKIARARRVLSNAWKLHDQIAQLNGVCLRDLLDIPPVQLVITGASLGHDHAVAALIEGLCPLHDLLVALHLDLLSGRRRRWAPRRAPPPPRPLSARAPPGAYP